MSSSENLPRLAPLRIWIPFCGWLILIFALSAYPKALIPQGKYISWDKIAHVLEFGIFGYFTARAAYFSGVPALHFNWRWLSLVFGILYAASDEWHQLFVAGRWASPYDVIADAIGVILGVWYFNKIRRGKKIKT
jgi:VanZ family protein